MGTEPIQGQPGLYRDTETGVIYNIRDFREGDKYDSLLVPAGTIQPGSEFIFFQNIQGKRELDTNIKTPRKLSAGESMIMDRIGLYFRLATGNVVSVPRDMKKIFENSFYRLKINDILQDEGPAIKFPSGYGIYGMTMESDAGIVSLGVPASASAAKLIKTQVLNQNHELDGVLRFDQRTWLQNEILASDPTHPYVNPDIDLPVVVTNYLHGLIRAAVSK
jgi:hypothetical protein